MRFANALLMCILLTGVGLSASVRAEPTPPSETAGFVPADLDALLSAFRGSVGVEARFNEKRVMALLAAPLESKGIIHFSPPGLLARYVTHPSPSFQIITPKHVRLGDDRKEEVIDLAKRPHVRAFVETFVALLAGDRDVLSRSYSADFSVIDVGSVSRWKVVLKPIVAPVNRVIQSISLIGSGLVIIEMRVLEVEGDETITEFYSVNPQRAYTESERLRLFERRAP